MLKVVDKYGLNLIYANPNQVIKIHINPIKSRIHFDVISFNQSKWTRWKICVKKYARYHSIPKSYCVLWTIKFCFVQVCICTEEMNKSWQPSILIYLFNLSIIIIMILKFQLLRLGQKRWVHHACHEITQIEFIHPQEDACGGHRKISIVCF